MEESAKVLFLQAVAQTYNGKCPQLASHLGLQLALNLKRNQAILCMNCSTLFSPLTSAVWTLTARQLKKKRRKAHVKGQSIVCLTQARCSSYVVVSCKVCKKVTVVGAYGSTASKLPPPSSSFSTPPTSYSTPKLTSSRRKKSGSLRDALHLSQKLDQGRTIKQATSPKLTDFLTSIK